MATKVYWKPPYLQYHDSQQGFWSLFFTDDKDSTEFFRELGEVCTIDRADSSAKCAPVAATAASNIQTAEAMKTDIDKIDSTDAMKCKSDVVYRVSKIGHQLPKIKANATDDESDLKAQVQTDHIANPKTATKPINAASDGVHPPLPHPPKPTNISSVALQPSPIWASLSSPSASTFDLNTFAAESRIQNTEVRMNLTKLDSKLDRVLDNVERK